MISNVSKDQQLWQPVDDERYLSLKCLAPSLVVVYHSQWRQCNISGMSASSRGCWVGTGLTQDRPPIGFKEVDHQLVWHNRWQMMGGESSLGEPSLGNPIACYIIFGAQRGWSVLPAIVIKPIGERNRLRSRFGVPIQLEQQKPGP